MASFTYMRRATHKPEGIEETSARPLLLRVGSGSLAGGISFLIWAYLDSPDTTGFARAVVDLLSFTTPVLFLSGSIELYSRCGGRAGWIAKAGIVLVCIGSAWGATAGIEHITSSDTAANVLAWLWTHLPFWWPDWLFTGLAMVSIATVGTLRGLGATSLATSVFGLIYLLTDTHATFEARASHIGAGVLLGLGWVALGILLYRGEPQRAENVGP